jgi:cytochrome c553
MTDPLARTFSVLALLASAASPLALANDAPRQVPACAACHGAQGVSALGDVPNLAGQKADYLQRQLKAFRDGARKNDLMAAIAQPLSDDDIRTLAAHWSALPAGGTAAAAAASTHAASNSLMRLPADFPAGFRDYWRRVDEARKTIEIAHANGVAWQAASKGQELPDGSIIVNVTYDAARGADGQWMPGAVRGYSAMERRAGWGEVVPELLRNDNWHYGLFTAQGASRLNTQRLGWQHAACLACHSPLAGQSYLFTWPDLRKAAAGER